MIMTHFQQRAVEHTGISDPDALYCDLRIALADPDRWSDYIEPVKTLADGSTAYRFRIMSGIFYAVVKDGYPLTVYTQTHMRNKKWAIKAKAIKRHSDASIVKRGLK
jgi:hypothetical protein